MKFKNIIILAILTIVSQLFAQEPNDCVNAITVCGGGNFMSNASGIGNTQEVSGCGGFEHNSIWLRIDIAQSGTLGFDLIPENTDITVDYDFWVYGPNRLCSNLGSPIRCSTTNPQQAGLADNHTGIDGSTTLTQTGPGANGNGYVYWLNVTAGEYYYIAIDRPSGDGGFEIQWTGTASSGTGAFPSPPAVNAIDDLIQCSSTPDVGIFDLASVISSINPDLVNNTTEFYASLADATDGINPLPLIYANTSNPQQIYAKVTSGNTDCYSLIDFNLVVSIIPTASIAASNPAICSGGDAVFTISGTPNAFIEYSIDGGTTQQVQLDALGEAIITQPAITSSTTASLTGAEVQNASGATVCFQFLNESATVNVGSSPTVSLSSNSPICSGADALFTITGTPDDIVDYNLNSSGTQQVTLDGTGEAIISVIGATSDQTIVLEQVTNPALGCSSTLSDTETVTVNPNPTASLSSNGSVCSGADAVFTITGTSDAIVDYNLNGSGTQQVTLDATGQAVISVLGATSDQTIILELVTNPTTGCSSILSDTGTVTVNPNPTASLSSNGPICSGTDAIFTITGTPETMVDYSLNSSATEQVTIGNTGQAVITVTVATTDQTLILEQITSTTTGCSSTLSDTVTVTVNSNPTAGLSSNGPICSGEDAIFTITGTSDAIVDYNLNGSGTQQAILDAVGQAVITVIAATSNQTLVFEQITNPSTGCIVTLSETETVTVNALPSIVTPSPLVVCDDAIQDGFTQIDLQDKDIEITGGNASYSVSYHLTQAFADLGTPELSMPYTNVSNPQTVYVRVEDTNTGCFSTTLLELEVINSIGVNVPSDLTFCDPDNDGFGVFDLESKTAEITGGDPDLAVTYHETETNAENNIAPLSSPYNNIVAFNQTIWVRVENTTTATECPTVIEMQLVVLVTPEIQDPEPYIICDDDDDSVAIFDLTTRNDEILNGLSTLQYSIEYFESQTNAENQINVINLPQTYTNTSNPQTIWVRVENNTTGCYSLTTLELQINSLPIVNMPTPLELCDDDTADEITVFDLTVKTDEITEGNTDNIIVEYYETYAGALSGTNPIDPDTAYTNTSINGEEANPQTIHIRVENVTTGCFALTTMTIRVLPNPTPTPSENLAFLNACDVNNPGDMIEEFDLTTQETLIINNEPGVTATYYESLSDAETGTNSIASPSAYNNISSPQTIYVRVTNDTTGCYTIVNFDLIVYPVPQPELEPVYTLCLDTNGTEVIGVPIIDTGFDTTLYSFQWSYDGSIIGGANDSYYEATQPGVYAVLITNLQLGCEFEVTATVNEAAPPTVVAEVTSQAFSDSHTIEVSATGVGADSQYEYSLDNGQWQLSNIFEDVDSGSHLVRVREINGCGEGSYEVFVVDYPPYFTPNGDGYHDTWRISGLENFPSVEIYIFDRYGKLLKELNPTGPGWDGTLKGSPLPTSDYWFVISYEESGQAKEFRSHFTLKR